MPMMTMKTKTVASPSGPSAASPSSSSVVAELEEIAAGRFEHHSTPKTMGQLVLSRSAALVSVPGYSSRIA